jgi:hypothetical protein
MRRKQSTSKAPRLPGDKPRPRTCGLKRREVDILKAVASLHVATAEDVRLMLAMRSRPYMGELLKKLCGGADRKNTHYLYRFGLPHAPGNFRRLYTLTRRGRQVLRELGVEVVGWYRPEKASHLSFSFLIHHLAVSQVLVALALFVRKYPQFQLVETRPWFAMAFDPPRLTTSHEGGETTISVIPDAWVWIERTHEDPAKIHGFGLWFEIDRGTEAKAKFQQVLLDRINFIRYKGYEAFFNATSCFLVYLAIGPTMQYRLGRLHTMRQWTMELLRKERISDWGPVFRFSTIDESLYDTLMLFTDPVFYRPDSDTLVSLFPPSPDKEQTDGQITLGNETHTNYC